MMLVHFFEDIECAREAMVKFQLDEQKRVLRITTLTPFQYEYRFRV